MYFVWPLYLTWAIWKWNPAHKILFKSARHASYDNPYYLDHTIFFSKTERSIQIYGQVVKECHSAFGDVSYLQSGKTSAAPWPFWVAPSHSGDWHTPFYIAVLSIFLSLSLDFCQWWTCADRVLTLNMNIRCALFGVRPGARTVRTHSHVLVWCIGSDCSDCRASELFNWQSYVLNNLKYWKHVGLLRDISNDQAPHWI